MFDAFRKLCERWLRIPRDPEPPPGDEASTQLFRAAPNFFSYLFVLWVLGTFAGLAIVAGVLVGPVIGFVVAAKKGEAWAPLLLSIPALLLTLLVLQRLFRLAVLRLDFEKRWYLVTDRSLRVREGIVSVKEMTVTFANIQNISISQGPVQRLLGISDLRVETAGGGGGDSQHHSKQNLHVARFRGINNAAQVLELIQQRLREYKDAGLGDHDDTQETSRMAAGESMLAALREVRHEVRGLRQAAERRWRVPVAPSQISG